MAFLANKTINLVNLHYAIHSVAMGGGAAFVSAFLLKNGIAPPLVLGSVALILAARFVLRPIAIGFAIRYGLRQLLIAGSILSALQYPVLAEVHEVGGLLVAFCLLGALGDTVYWSSYHAYFASVGDDDNRGKHVGTREAVVAIIGIFAPLAAGWLLQEAGPRVAFGLTALVVALSAIPLHASTVVAGLGGRAITKASLRGLFERALRDELEPLTFLDLNQAAINRELEREKAQRRSGPSAENILRDLAGGAR